MIKLVAPLRLYIDRRVIDMRVARVLSWLIRSLQKQCLLNLFKL